MKFEFDITKLVFVSALGVLVASRAVHAFPVAPTLPRAGVSVPIVSRNAVLTPEERVARLIRQRVRLQTKYGASGSETHVKRASSGSATLDDTGPDVQYSAQFSIGTPAQQYNVILDTGSSDLWLASSACTTGPACPTLQSKFTAGSSNSFKTDNQAFSLEYGSGAISGVLASDTVALNNFTISNQTFAVIDQVSDGVLLSPVLSGLMGLAWPSLASSKANPWWFSVFQSGQWSQPLFGMFLARFDTQQGAPSEEKQGGSLDLGFMNSQFYEGSMNFVKLAMQSFWAIPMDGFIVNGKTTTTSGIIAAIDSGTSLIGASAAQVQKFYQSVPGAIPGTGSNKGFYIYPCNTNLNVSLTFGGISYSMLASEFSTPIDSRGQQCMGALSVLDVGQGIDWIVGDVFMKNVYTVFQADPPQIGFATVKGGNIPKNAGSRRASSPTRFYEHAAAFVGLGAAVFFIS